MGIGPVIGKELTNKAILSVLVAAVLMLCISLSVLSSVLGWELLLEPCTTCYW